jgi:hypothetical protein
MKKVLSAIFLLSFFISGTSQPLVIEWQNCFGGSMDDKAFDLVRTQDGYLIAGFWELRDVWLIKTDLAGNLIWEKKLGGSDIEGPKRILSLNDGNYVIVCGSYSSDGDIGNDPYPESNDYWVVKVNGSGDILWERIYGGNCIEQMWDGVKTTDGGIIALGYTCSEDGDISNYYGTWDTWIIKLDNDGNKIWDFTMGTEDFDIASAIIETSDRGFLVSCSSTPTTGGNIDCQPFNEFAEIVLFKLDSVANIEWQQCYGGSDSESVLDIVETVDGYLLACSAYSNDGDIIGAGYHLGYENSGSQTRDIWLVKIDINGNIIWSKCYGGTKNETPHRVFQTEDSGFIVFGEAGSFDGDVTGNHSAGPGISDIWVFKIDSVGQLLWQQCIGGNGYERIESGVVDNGNGSYAIASTIYDFNSGQVECPTTIGSYQVWVIQVRDTTVVSVPEKLLAVNAVKVYPNPANEYVLFELQKPLHTGTITITDITGRPISSFPITGEKTVWQTEGVKPGVYLYKLESNGKIGDGKILIGW